MKYRKKATILLAAFIILSFVCMAIANGIQTDGGKVAIEDGSIETDLGTLTYKLYKPETASEQQPAPGLLLLQSKYDEFSYFRDYANTVTDELLDQPVRTEFLGVSAEESDWNTTYGDFADGSARRIELLNTNHRLTTHNTHGMMTAIEWLTNAIGMDTSIASADQVFLGKEWLVFLAMMLAIAAMIPFMELLLTTAFFAPVAQGVPDRPEKAKSGWWRWNAQGLPARIYTTARMPRWRVALTHLSRAATRRSRCTSSITG